MIPVYSSAVATPKANATIPNVVYSGVDEVFPTSLGMIFSGFISIYLGVISQRPSDHNLKPAILNFLSPDRHRDRKYLVPH